MTEDQGIIKIRWILSLFILVFVLLLFRVWHLTTIQQDKLRIESKKPQTRTMIHYSNRGIIQDRYQTPLALNRIQYNATIYYAHLQQLPSVRWEEEPNGEKKKHFPRREYINALASLLGKELDLDPLRIEDLIHAKAALFPHLPLVLKENISETQYFRLRMLERKWAGIRAEICSRRFYPYDKSASDVIGHLGAITQEEYQSILQQIQSLQNHLLPTLEGEWDRTSPEAMQLQELKEKSYTVHDLVGKMGIEKAYETSLRGFHGKKVFSVDSKGSALRETSASKKPISGKSITSTISLELQQFAEELLAADESIRNRQSRVYDSQKRETVEQKQPWIKGGAIVAMDPSTGEVLALASYPRWNPNDFIPCSLPSEEERQRKLHQWLESPQYRASLWEGTGNLSREKYSSFSHQFSEERQPISWEFFLQSLLPKESPVKWVLDNLCSVKNAISLLEDVESLLYFSQISLPKELFDQLFPHEDGNLPSLRETLPQSKKKWEESLRQNGKDIEPIKRRVQALLTPIPHNLDKLFLIDLLRITVYNPAFSNELIEKTAHLSLSAYWTFSQNVRKMERVLQEIVRPLFHQLHFTEWREKNQKDFLRKKRREEAEQKTYQRPYIDYLDRKERELFLEFWKEWRIPLLCLFVKGEFAFSLPSEEEKEEMPSFDRMKDQLTSYFPYLLEKREEALSKRKPFPWIEDFHALLLALSSLSPSHSAELLQTVRSLFSLDRPLLGAYRGVCREKGIQLERHLATSFYPLYGFGYGKPHSFSQSAPLGSIFKLITTYAALEEEKGNPKNLFATHPLMLIDDVQGSSICSTVEGKPFFRFYKGGRLPTSAHPHIGKIDLIGALEASSNPYFSILAGDYLTSPLQLLRAAQRFGLGRKTGIALPGEYGGSLPKDLELNQTGLYSFAIGQHSLLVTPLQTAVLLSSIANGGRILQPKITLQEESPQESSLPLSVETRNILLEAMEKAVWGLKGSARPDHIKKIQKKPKWLSDFLALQPHFVGKTSTAELLYFPDLLPSSPSSKYKHIWFGALSFEPSATKRNWSKPELVVIVYLRYGDGGKEAAPLAAQMVKKYREIRQKYEVESP